MFILLGLLFSTFFIIAGVVFIYGTKRRWPIMTDPPQDLWLCYSQAFIKKVFGNNFLIVHNYSLGAIFILLGLIGLWNGLKN
jgi:hypothetical protein